MKRSIHYTITICANLCYVFSVENWIPYRTSRGLVLDMNNLIETNQTTSFDHNLTVNATDKHSNPDEFWLWRDHSGTEDMTQTESDNFTTESKIEMSPVETNEDPKPPVLNDPEWMKECEMNELLFMSRNNCDLDLQINEWEDRKLKIQYETLKTGMSGQCRIGLRGRNGILLAVLVSNVQLNGNESRVSPSEILKVVVKNNHFDYTLKEFVGNEEYYPVMLTESDRVYLILLFNGTNAIRMRSSYNLEVFDYYKNENNLNMTLQGVGHYGYSNSTRNVDNIFLTTAAP